MNIFAKKHLLAWLIGGLVVVNLATLAFLWIGRGRRPGPGPAGRSEARPGENRPDDVRKFLERELGLTPEQSARFEELRRGHAADIHALQEEIRALKKAEMEALIADEGAPGGGADLAAQIGDKEAEKERHLFAHLREIMALLSPDQQKRFRSIVGELLRMMGPPGPEPRPAEGPEQPGAKPPRRPGEKPPQREPGPPRGERR